MAGMPEMTACMREHVQEPMEVTCTAENMIAHLFSSACLSKIDATLIQQDAPLIQQKSWSNRSEHIEFLRGLESEFTIAGPYICALMVWFEKFSVLVDLFWPNKICEHLVAKDLIMCPFHLAIGY